MDSLAQTTAGVPWSQLLPRGVSFLTRCVCTQMPRIERTPDAHDRECVYGACHVHVLKLLCRGVGSTPDPTMTPHLIPSPVVCEFMSVVHKPINSGGGGGGQIQFTL